MGANNHTTVAVDDSPEKRAKRLVGALKAVDSIKDVHVSEYNDTIVRFHLTDDCKRMPADVMRVLAEHNAGLSGGCLDGTCWSGSIGWGAVLNET